MKIKKKSPSNEIFKNKMHKKIPNTRSFDLFLKKSHDFHHFIIIYHSPFHIELFKLSHKFLNQ
jgi:hypothetical protein